ncbi:MAG TPA: hypothetical protein VF060_05020 [Trebonia sp.]
MGRSSMSFTTKAALGVTAAAAVCLSAVGCGTSSDPLAGMTAKQIATKAISDLKSAPSFTATGSGPYDGQTATMSFGVKGNGCTMTVDMGSKGSMTMTMIGTTSWVKGDAAFWKAATASQGGGTADMGNMFAGKYLKIPADAGSGLPPTAGMCDVNQMTSSSSQMPLTVDVAKGTMTTVNGQKVYTLTDKAKDITMYVTDTSTPQIIKVVSKQNGNSGEFTITFGAPKSITAPPASETAVLPGLGS